MENDFQAQFDRILSERHERLSQVNREKSRWERLSALCEAAQAAVSEADRLNPHILGSAVDEAKRAYDSVRAQTEKFQRLGERFSRNDLCIGIGGAARMGKSTFLQAITGLGEAQIPTSDRYFTTAGRSLIVNGEQNCAIADMHTENSFLTNVIAPMCRELDMMAPHSIDDFLHMDLGNAGSGTQQQDDIRQRLLDAQAAMPVIRSELTGERGRRIPLRDLRDYVAYPEDGRSKAGKFMAVANIVIYVPFPQVAVRQLRVMDLPGLGEAGRDLARVQTSGMSDVCDMTLLMKRPTDSNVAWTHDDSAALDAMQAAVPLLKEQYRYTAILANVDGERTAERADGCVNAIKQQIGGRGFEIIRCNARDREAVLNGTMPRIMKFMVDNLPAVDRRLFENVLAAAEKTASGLMATVESLRSSLKPYLQNVNSISFGEDFFKRMANELVKYEDELRDSASGQDPEWIKEIVSTCEKVKAWISGGCGYGSKEQLVEEIRQEIMVSRSQPDIVVNQVRIAFREQWELMDEHLRARTAGVLERFLAVFNTCTCNFVPAVEPEDDRLEMLRRQLCALADKLENTPEQQPGDEERLAQLSRPLRRLSQFDLRFRFHVEPMLVAATQVLQPNRLPIVTGQQDAGKFADEMLKVLNGTADEYARALEMNQENGDDIAKRDRIIDSSVIDKYAARALKKYLNHSVSGMQSFSPSRIFAAILESTVDAFIRSRDSRQAFDVWTRGCGAQLREQPSEARKALWSSYGAVEAVKKALA